MNHKPRDLGLQPSLATAVRGPAPASAYLQLSTNIQAQVRLRLKLVISYLRGASEASGARMYF